MTQASPIRLTKKTFHIWQLFKSYWQNSSTIVNLLLVIVIIFTGILQVCALLALNDWNKLFFNAIQMYDTSSFFRLSVYFAIVVLTISVSIASNNYFVGILSLKWRVYLTHSLKNAWLTEQRCSRLQQLTQIDNPEQRITDDLSLMPQLSLKIANNLFQAAITLIIFGYELWTLSAQWGMQYHGHMLAIPGIYLWGTLVYAAFFNMLVFKMGHKLIALNYLNQKLTATFRCMMTMIREHSQPIVLHKQEPYHQEATNKAFQGIVANTLAILRVDRLVQFIRQLSINSCSLFIFVIALPAYFAYHLQIGYLMQVNGAALFFIKGLSVLIDAYEDIAALRASEQRVTELVSTLESMGYDEAALTPVDASNNLTQSVKSSLVET